MIIASHIWLMRTDDGLRVSGARCAETKLPELVFGFLREGIEAGFGGLYWRERRPRMISYG